MNLAWLGLFISLNHTAPVHTYVQKPQLAVEATAVVGVGKATVTAIYIQPNGRPMVSVGVGVRVF